MRGPIASPKPYPLTTAEARGMMASGLDTFDIASAINVRIAAEGLACGPVRESDVWNALALRGLREAAA